MVTLQRQMKQLLVLIFCLVSTMAFADETTVSSPDGRLKVTLTCEDGRAMYAVSYNGEEVLSPSLLGLSTNIGDFTKDLKMMDNAQVKPVEYSYHLSRSKTSRVYRKANVLTVGFETASKVQLTVTFSVSDNDIAFRYGISRGEKDNPKCAVILGEVTSFNLPVTTRTFICPQITPMTGWERTKPSYEEEYIADAPIDTVSQYGVGYTFPCLFRIPRATASVPSHPRTSVNPQPSSLLPPPSFWVLISETGVGSNYCGCRLSDYHKGTGYSIAFPQEGENNGVGSTSVGIPLPFQTPWRTITVGTSLKPIVETTVQFDVVEPLYQASQKYEPGRYTWSWLVWQDSSCNYDDQIRMIDLASSMGYEYVLVDALWDVQIGYNRVEELASYAKTKGVRLLLWYNSNGYENDAPQGPRGVMNNSIARKRDMTWMKRIGVAGIKVDFFGGDKQETLRLYEEILSDANDYGLQVIFHGCTLPRGWERMYPNYVGSEAALASENVFFTDYHARREGFQMAMHPFARNAVGSFDWGGMMMNRMMSRDNKSRHQRFTSDIFELATSITNQASVNCVAMYPNNLDELPQFELDFLRNVPTTWDDTRFIDGYPTRYAVIARKNDNRWYVGGINGTQEPITLTLSLPMFAGRQVTLYYDEPLKKDQLWPNPAVKTVKVGKHGDLKVTLQPMGGIVLVQQQ